MTCIHGNEDCPNARCREEATAALYKSVGAVDICATCWVQDGHQDDCPRKTAAATLLCGCVFAAGRPPSWCGMHEPLQLESSQDAALMVGDDLSSHPGSGKLLASQPLGMSRLAEEWRGFAEPERPSAAYNFPVFFKPEYGHAPAEDYALKVEVSEAWRQAIAENDQRDLAALTTEAVAAWQNWWLAQDAESDE